MYISAYHDFIGSEEYKKWTDPKKEVFNRYVREAATAKDPRSIDFTILDSVDLQKIRKKVEDIA